MMTARLAPLAFVAILLTSADVAAQHTDSLTAAYPADRCRACAGWSESADPFRVHGNTYFVGTRGLSAILITSSEGHVLIDGGLPNTAPLIVEQIRSLGFSEADVALILNSHAHYDHAGGIAALQRASGARVAASQASAAVLEQGTPEPDDPQHASALPFPPVPNVERFMDSATLRVGPLSLTAYRTAGHTPGSTTWSWVSCEGSECLTIVYADSQTPVSDDGFLFSRNTTYRSAVADFERAFAVLESLRCDILLTPHPGASALWERRAAGSAGLIDATACRRYAAKGRQQLARRLETEAGVR
jgi:metallo-beta-lactamase class B